MSRAKPSLPRLSIGIPVFNSEDRLGLFLPFLLRQSYPGRLLDLIFVDGESSDLTLEILLDFKRKYSSRFNSVKIESMKYPDFEANLPEYYHKVSNITAARNRIVELSPKENDLLFIDDDMGMHQNAVQELAAFAYNNKADIAAPLMVSARQRRSDGKIEILLTAWGRVEDSLRPIGHFICSGKSSFPLASWKREYNCGCPVDAVGTGFMFIKRHVLERVKFRFLTDPDAPAKGEDLLFCLDSKALGYTVLLDLDLWVDHHRYRYKKTVSHGVLTLKFLGNNCLIKEQGPIMPQAPRFVRFEERFNGKTKISYVEVERKRQDGFW